MKSQIDQKAKCDIHQLPLLFVDNKQGQEVELLCQKCVQNKFSIFTIEDFYSQQLQSQIQKQQESIDQLKQLMEGLELYRQSILQILDRLYISVSECIKTLQNKQLIFQGYCDTLNQSACQEIEVEKINFQNIMKEIASKVSIEITALSNVSQTDKLFKLLKNFDVNEQSALNNVKLEQIGKFQSNYNSSQSNININKKINYQLVTYQSYKQNEYAIAIAFNKNALIMIAGCLRQIKVFEFKEGNLREIQQLNDNAGNICCLLFMQKSNQFISASQGGTIIFWEYQRNSQWQSVQVLKAHTSYIFTITINQNEDMLISGSSDCTIKFWQRENNTWNSQQSIQCSSHVYSVSLSNNEDKLIASIGDKQILVIKLQGKEWIIIQKISVEQYGYRLGFISQDQFVFQPRCKQFLQIFDYDQNTKSFKLGEVVKYQDPVSSDDALFPIRYISSIGLILIKNDKYINLLRRTQNGSLKVEQSIQLSCQSNYGCISDDGRYIATWDQGSKEIQIRKLIE